MCVVYFIEHGIGIGMFINSDHNILLPFVALISMFFSCALVFGVSANEVLFFLFLEFSVFARETKS